MIIDDEHFRQFAVRLEEQIDKYGITPGDEKFLEYQKSQVERLVALEEQFRLTLISHWQGSAIYKAFIRYIRDERGNILDARPYFRERQPVFTKKISKALEDRADKSLYKFHVNYRFVQFALSVRTFGKKSKLNKLAREIEKVRTELIEMNMPLAISRVRIFWSRTPQSHLSYMDLVQIACEGLMSAIDKFCLPFSKVFRSVAIGRIVGNFIEEYSETLVHFFPRDKRNIYRANKLIHKFAGNVDYEALAAEVNVGVEPTHRTTASEIADLMAAASCVSADDKGPPEHVSAGGAPDSPITNYAAPEMDQPDVAFEHREAMAALQRAILQLPLWDQKLLALKGVSRD